MSAVQLSFGLRTSSSVKTVHLLGSWDHYSGQLPLAKDKTSSKAGSWKGTFRFQGATLPPGQRYWYYYIIDGYHVTHDPAVSSTTEPTTGRVLNILDVPREKSSSKPAAHKSPSSSKHASSSKSSSHKSPSSSKHASSGQSSSSHASRHSSSHEKHASSSHEKHPSSSHDRHASSSRRQSRRDSLSRDIPKGRPLSVSQIKAPKPITPHATKHILQTDFAAPTVEELTSRFSAATIDYDDYEYSSSPPSSVGSSLSSRSDSSSSISSLSDYGAASLSCSCERYGITRAGDRVKLDCGGSRCGYDGTTDSCCSSDEEDKCVSASSRRNGVVIRR